MHVIVRHPRAARKKNARVSVRCCQRVALLVLAQLHGPLDRAEFVFHLLHRALQFLEGFLRGLASLLLQLFHDRGGGLQQRGCARLYLCIKLHAAGTAEVHVISM